jgi:hypothetical protein
MTSSASACRTVVREVPYEPGELPLRRNRAAGDHGGGELEQCFLTW